MKLDDLFQCVGKIEKNVPLPSRHWTGCYTFSEYANTLQKGDSILVRVAHHNGTQGSLAGALASAGRVHGYKFTVRKVAGGYRVWRVK